MWPRCPKRVMAAFGPKRSHCPRSVNLLPGSFNGSGAVTLQLSQPAVARAPRDRCSQSATPAAAASQGRSPRGQVSHRVHPDPAAESVQFRDIKREFDELTATPRAARSRDHGERYGEAGAGALLSRRPRRLSTRNPITNSVGQIMVFTRSLGASPRSKKNRPWLQ